MENRRLLPIFAMIALMMSGNGLVAPILSLYAQTFSVASTLVGALITVFGVGRLLANMPAGVLSQRFRRRPMLALGPAVVVGSSIGAALAGSFPELVLWRFVQGIGSGIYMTTSAAALADNAAPDQRGRVMALYQGALLLGAGIGPGIGGLLAQNFGYTAPFWALAAVAVAALLTALFSFEESSPPPRSRETPRAPLGILLQPMFAVACLASFSVFFTRTAAQWLLIPLVGHERFGLGLDQIGLALTAMAVANFAVLPWAGGFVDRWGSRSAAVLSTLLLGLGVAAVAAAVSPAMFWAAMVVIGVAGGINGPAVAAYAVDIVPRDLYGPSIGLQRTAGDAGFVIGPLAVGLLDDLTAFGHTGGLVLTALVLFATALAFSRWARPRGAVVPAE